MSVHPEVGQEQAYLDKAERCLEEMRARTEAAIAVADNAAQEVDSEIARAHLRYRRRHVEDASGDPVVVDWRARVAVPFYRATAADSFGLRVRRRFMLEGDRLV